MPDTTVDREAIEREYFSLSTKVIYESFGDGASAEDEARLERLAKRLVELSAPKLQVVAA